MKNHFGPTEQDSDRVVCKGIEVCFDFTIGQEVKVIPIESMGRVLECLHTGRGKEYKIEYWFGGELKIAVVNGDDLTAARAKPGQLDTPSLQETT